MVQGSFPHPRKEFRWNGLTGRPPCTRFVQTDMGNAGARAIGMEKAFTETKDSVAGVVAQVCPRSLRFCEECTDGMEKIDAATKEKGSGSFAVWTGETFPW